MFLASRLHRVASELLLLVLTTPIAASSPQVVPTSRATSGSRAGLIFGQVVDASSAAPIPEAIVTMSMRSSGTLPTAPRARVMADSEGRFFFANVPPGDYWIGAAKEGYLGGRYGQRRASANDYQAFALGEGETRTDAKLVLWKYGVIAGVVLDENGEPAVGVEVRALVRNVVAGRTRFGTKQSAASKPPTATTDDRGMFRLSRLAPGSYVIVVPSIQTTLPVAVLNGYAQDHTLLAHLLELTVPNDSNNWEAELQNTALGQSRTLQIGDFALISMNRVLIPPPAMPDGRMQVYRTTYYPAAPTAVDASVITLASGDERTDINVTLRPLPAVRLSGRIVLPDGTPPAPTPLRLVGESAAGVGEVGLETVNGMSDATGRFVLLGVPAGEYRLKSANTDFELNAIRGVPSFWTDQRVVVGSGDVEDLTVSLQPALRVEGRVEFRDATGLGATPPRGPFLTVVGFDSVFGDQWLAAQFSGGTTFGTVAAPGRYIAQPYESAPWFLQSVTLDGKDITDKPFELQSDATSLVVVYGQQHAMVSGTVRDAHGDASPTALVLAFPTDRARWSGYGSSPRFISSTPASRTGAYVFNNLPAGEYFIIAIDAADADGWPDLNNLERLASRAERLTVVTAGSKTLDLAMKAIR